MADPLRASSVYRYFDLADAFLRIRVVSAEHLAWPERTSLNRASYRRAVVEACMPELGPNCQEAVHKLFPEDPLLVEDLLYQMCVEVNPALEIHEVRVPEANGPSERRIAPRTRDRKDDSGFRDRLRKLTPGLERRLERGLVGQSEAIATVVRALRRAAAGLNSTGRPLASLLFLGRTGTGKTELARLLAREVFRAGEQRSLLRIDCSEYANAHEYAKLIGAPPGYVGHEHGGSLTEALVKNPECVVLFDEFEKAHSRLHNLLLQVLEEGELTDGRGRHVSFERAVVVLTANSGAEEQRRALRAVGFERQSQLGKEALAGITQEVLEGRFAPELLGRLDSVVVFEELGHGAVQRVAARLLADLARRSRARGLPVAFSPAVARWVAARAGALEFGAREVRHLIERTIEPLLADVLLDQAPSGATLWRLRICRGQPKLEQAP